jgi:glutamine---fructose-6-phosphate transaminase (isomerizing)
MCGIIGYIGYRPVQAVLLEGLRRLEYRGYDSAGIAWREGAGIERVRAVGNLDALDTALAVRDRTPEPVAAAPARPAEATALLEATAGIGHTRWATHGGVTEENAHPHADGDGRIMIVLNGIIENHGVLRDRLTSAGITYRSDTDAEVVAHLISLYYQGDLAQAVRRAAEELSGHYAFVAMCADEPDTLVGTRRECPLVAGIGDGEHFLASSIAAFLGYTRETVLLRDGEIAILRPAGVTVLSAAGAPRPLATSTVDWDADRIDRAGYETFMLKEIHEQGTAVAETLRGLSANRAPGYGGLSDRRLLAVSKIVVVACGTSYHAGLAGQLAVERWARMPVDVAVASEFRYQDPIVGPDTLVLGITQSGETADTLAAMRLARDRGATVVAVTNAPGSQATREADAVLFTRAGIELGVAATKTFVAQVVLLYALALRLAGLRGTLAPERCRALQADLERLPGLVNAVVAAVDEPARELGRQLASRPFFLYLGRLAGLPVAMEGALKLKEISYVPTDAYPAGEMKHGPIALLGDGTPVICVAIEDAVLPKLLSNIAEVRARGALVVAVGSEGSKELAEHAESVFYVPCVDPVLQIPLAIVPLQLFAYHVARARGLNVDQPRNLAKTVTVE